jgi:hypothetical protein
MALQILKLERFAYLPEGTFGFLTFPWGGGLYTVERPWQNNAPFRSCIPEGVYPLKWRGSPTIDRITKGKFKEGWELQNVPKREHILIHPGNWPSSVEGCIAVGSTFLQMKDPKGPCPYGVSRSQDAFEDFMMQVKKGTEYEIHIRAKQALATT